MNNKKKSTRYVVIVALFILFIMGVYHFSHKPEEEIELPSFLINTNAEVVVTDIPIDYSSTTNSTVLEAQ